MTVTELRRELDSGSLTSEQLVLIFAERCSTIGAENNYVATPMFDKALEMARNLDKERQNSLGAGKVIPALHGIPISVKEMLKVDGVRYTCGYASSLVKNLIADTDSVFVRLLRDQGCIPLVTSNVPQGLFSLETRNQIYGIAYNPWDKTRTVGGSSGGEGGLISTRCTPLGVGSDTAGSVRVPAAFCGTYSFKPSRKRISVKGRINPFISEIDAFKECPATIGPMANSVDDLANVMRAIFGKVYKYDKNVSPLEFVDADYELPLNKSLRIGYIFEGKHQRVSSGIKNVISEVVEGLKIKGHQLIPLDFNLDEFFYLYFSTAPAIGQGILKTLDGENPEYYVLDLAKKGNIKPWMITAILAVWRMLNKKDTRMYKLLEFSKPAKNVPEFLGQIVQLEILRKKFLDYLEKNQIDAIVCPVFPSSALKLGQARSGLMGTSFSLCFSIMDMPSGVVPIRLSRAPDNEFPTEHNDFLEKEYQRALENADGLPLAIQVGALPFKDELCLGLMKEIERIYPFRQLPPGIV